MPGMYPEGEYDLAGFAWAWSKRTASSTAARIVAGDVVLGLASSGPHSNGYSLIRRILRTLACRAHGGFPRPHAGRWIARTHAHLREAGARFDARGGRERPRAHHRRRTAGKCSAHAAREHRCRARRNSWPRPPLFDWLQQNGGVADQEMFRVFNCGIGMVVIVAEADGERALQSLTACGETVYRIGRIAKRTGAEAQTRIA